MGIYQVLLSLLGDLKSVAIELGGRGNVGDISTAIDLISGYIVRIIQLLG